MVVLSLLLLVTACPKKPPKKPKPEGPVTIPTAPMPTESLSPKRVASQRIVQVGKEYLETGDLDKAVQTFQEAINVDAENGVAYFFLAFGLYRVGLYEDAEGLLDRADTLLAPYREWQEEVVKLRFLIEGAKEAEAQEKSLEKEGYY